MVQPETKKMIKIRIKRNMKEQVLQEAMRVEEMGLPDLIVTFIKEDIPKNREAQVGLGNILKGTTLPMILIDALGSAFGNWQRKLADAWEKTDTVDTDVNLDDLTDRTTKLFQFLYSDVEKGRRYQMDKEYAGVNYTEDSMKAIDLKAIKGMRKALTKNLIKYGWHSSAAKTMDLFLDEILIRYYDNFIRENSEGQQLVAFLNEHPDNHEDVADMTWLDASNFAAKYFIEKEDEDMIIKRYPKKNMFWYNIGKGACSLEAGRMGHCGEETETGNAILYSLRRKNPKMKVSDSHVTISYVEEEEAVYQIKGKGNCHPEPKYGPYVVDFLKMMEVKHVHETGQYSKCDFSEFIQYLQEKYPEAEYKETYGAELDQLDDEIRDGQFNTEYVHFYSNFEDYDEPYIVIDGDVNFYVPLEQFDESQREKLKDQFNSDYNTYADELMEVVGFSYWDGETPKIDFDNSDRGMRVNFYLQARDGENICYNREDGERLIEDMKSYYRLGDIQNYIETINEYLNETFTSLINPETAQRMEVILDSIDELEEGYNYFSVFDEGNEIHFQTGHIDLPIQAPYLALPHGLNAQKNLLGFRSYDTNLSEYLTFLHNMGPSIKKAFTNAIKSRHQKALDAASKQLSLTMAGLDLPAKEPEKELNIPQFVEMKIRAPQATEIKGESTGGRNPQTRKPIYKMHFILEIKHSDDVSDIYWGMEYVDYLDKHMAQIIREFGESKEIEEIKRQINKRHKDHLLAVVDKLRESKRRIKMKIV